MSDAGEVTRLLGALRDGDTTAEARLLEVVYPELRRIARRHLRGERSDHTLQPTALVNEAYLQLTRQLDKGWQGRSHFFAIAAQLMRRILVDYARHRRAAKREGRRQQVELTESLSVADDRLDEIIDVDWALQRLAAFDPRRATVVELRFFGGMTETEVGEVLNVAPRTVRRDWNLAKAWLHGELRQGERPAP
jgi:RNA polymerase sigma factor (TIGR02999 family)